MDTKTTLIIALSVAPAVALTTVTGCDRKETAPAASHTDDHGHEHGPGDDHSHESTSDHGHGAAIQLGEKTIGAFNAKAARDEGAIVAGKDAPIDVTVTPTTGSTAKVAAVRFWIGTEDAKGSVKARAEIEDPSEPNRWHTHAEVPSPIPAGAALWVEIEDDKGTRTAGSFPLQME